MTDSARHQARGGSVDRMTPGCLRPAPENFLDAGDIAGISQGRRDLLRAGFAAALAAVTGLPTAAAAAGEAEILEPQPWATSLGRPVAATPYGLPSKYERNLVRRQSPGLTQAAASSVSFTPLQGGFGILTPSGLHFERHHQGWHDIDPKRHRFMVNGAKPGFVRTPKVYTMDDLMRLPSVSRMYFLECGANTGMEWGNVAVPTVQYTHGMLSCSEFTGVPLRLLLEGKRRRPDAREVRAGRRSRRLVDDAHDPDGSRDVGRSPRRLRPER